MQRSRQARFRPARMALALVMTALVAALALWVNDGAQPPRWISHGLVPVLGWVYLALAAYAAGFWLWRKRRLPQGGGDRLDVARSGPPASPAKPPHLDPQPRETHAPTSGPS